MEPEKAATDTKKDHTWHQRSQTWCWRSKHSAEEAKVKLLTTKKDSEEAIAKF